jgi:3-ketosteroid 9alpha-monooxygenase subunit B
MSRLIYHPLEVLEVIEETADARTIVLAVPEHLRATFRFKPGQHLQIHVPCSAKPVPRCYSLTSTPDEPQRLAITVKRIDRGRVSGWLCSALKPGDRLEVAPPAGVFTPRSLDDDCLMFAAGSGITPIYCIIRYLLAHGRGRLRLIYANRDERSVIFAAQLARLARAHPQHLHVIHWLETLQGLPTAHGLAALAGGWEQAECYLCGPAPFMDAAQAALHAAQVPHARIHVERFVSLPEDADLAPPPATPGADRAPVEIEVELDGAAHRLTAQPGELLIEALEAAGLSPPFSCRAGACAACMCQLEEGEVELAHNHVLDDNDLKAGWILACQAIPKSQRLKIRYPS